MFKKILIANRGEIACRINKTAKKMGIETVAVFSDADQNSLHVSMSDQAFHLGASPVAESYLNGEKIIEIALATGSEAIHPGYGFLSENPGFAETVQKAGLVFIGPPPSAIRAMGLKDAAKELMEKADLPVVPGYHGREQDPDFLATEAERIGYPVLIKARSGGGGKGMRKIDHAKDFADAFSSAQRESKASFGDGACILEKYLEKSRHIELQIFGDSHGNTVHLFERDCSLQRRHQKIIEEAPAPGMFAELRRKMGETAVRAAKAIGYQGAGTVEFIVDVSKGLSLDSFYFMEMNTRLQVEHPVTELITGQDLVEWQILVAYGEKLPLLQDDIPLNGCSVEARVYAEDTERGFLPSTGRLHHVSLPDDCSRVDSGIRQGDTITHHYDPMIAKVIVHADTRATALNKMHNALKNCEIAGPSTNVNFLRKLIRHEKFETGDIETGLIDQDLPNLTGQTSPSGEALAIAALSSLQLFETADQTDPWSALRGYRNWGESVMHAELLYCDELLKAEVSSKGKDSFQVNLADKSIDISIVRLNEKQCKVIANGQVFRVKTMPFGNKLHVLVDGDQFEFLIPDPIDAADEATVFGEKILAPMPGIIKQLPVSKNQKIEKGQILAVLEAMKMEHTIYASDNCKIAEVFVKEGQKVSGGTILLNFSED